MFKNTFSFIIFTALILSSFFHSNIARAIEGASEFLPYMRKGVSLYNEGKIAQAITRFDMAQEEANTFDPTGQALHHVTEILIMIHQARGDRSAATRVSVHAGWIPEAAEPTRAGSLTPFPETPEEALEQFEQMLKQTERLEKLPAAKREIQEILDTFYEDPSTKFWDIAQGHALLATIYNIEREYLGAAHELEQAILAIERSKAKLDQLRTYSKIYVGLLKASRDAQIFSRLLTVGEQHLNHACLKLSDDAQRSYFDKEIASIVARAQALRNTTLARVLGENSDDIHRFHELKNAGPWTDCPP